jgi:uncharacterized OsmC-like protein
MSSRSVRLKDLYDRMARALGRRPSFGLVSAQARAELTGDASCKVIQGDRSLLVDLAPEDGGQGAGPHPGQLMRASVAACLAIGYRLWGDRLGVPVDHVEVELSCQYDVRGQLDLADVPPGWQHLDVHVRVTSAAPEEEVRRVVAHADRVSPMLANLAPSIARTHRVTIARPAPTAPRAD